MSLAPKIIPGAAHDQNRGASDWGCQGYIAYGCQQYVVVVDPETLQVRWNNEEYHHDIVHPYTLTIASGDSGGKICVWNIVTGETKLEFKEKNKAVKDICWINNKDTGDSSLLVLYAGSTLALWNCVSTSQIWKKSFTENMTSIVLDPFRQTSAAFLADDSIVLIDDILSEKRQENQAKKITFSGKNAGTVQVRRNSSSLNKLLNMTLMGRENRPSRKNITEEQNNGPQCLHIVYHQAIRHWLLMVYSDHVDIVDIDVSIVIGSIKLEQNASPFVRVIPCRQRDALICLHENSMISIRLRREDASHCTYNSDLSPVSPATPESPSNHSMPYVLRDVTYDLLWQSDSMRLTSSSTVFGYDVHPVSECKVSLICNDGKIVIWELVSLKPPFSEQTSRPAMTLSEFVPYSLRRSSRAKIRKRIKFLQTGVCRGSAHAVTIIKSNTSDELLFSSNVKGDHLLAVGTEYGSIHIIDLQSGQVEKEFSAHFDSVRGIEWVNQSQLLSWSYQQGSNSQIHGKNEITLLNLKSGRTEAFREQKAMESLIHIIKISPLRQYVIISFKEQPTEIWSLKTKTIVRELPASTMHPKAMVWSTMSTWRNVKKQVDMKLSRLQSLDENEVSLKKITQEEISGILKNIQLKKIAKEYCLLAGRDGLLCRLTLEDRSITDVVTYPSETNGIATLTHMAMKADYLLIADSNGMVCILNLADKKMKQVPKSSEKLIIKKIAFHSSSKDHKFYVLHETGVDIWLYKNEKMKMIGSLRTSKSHIKMIDIEWADTNNVAFITHDGAVHVRDLTQTDTCHTMKGRKVPEPFFCPYVLPNSGIPLMKHTLQHISNIEKLDIFQEQIGLRELINKQIDLIDRNVLQFLQDKNSAILEKCMVVSRIFGDKFDLYFWTLVWSCIHEWKEMTHGTDDVLISLDSSSDGLTVPGVHTKLPHVCTGTQYDVLMQPCCFRNQQLNRHRLHDKKRTTQEHRSVCVDNYILLEQIEDAVRLLLETNFQDEDYREDYLRACLLSCDRSNTTGQSTLKLVATHLIINGKLAEGVIVLMLMGKGLDGCKYLQSYGEWERAAWLAKAVLSREEYSEVFSKWTENFIKSNNMIDAVFVMLTEHKFYDVAKTLLHIGYLDMAANFVEVCNDVGIDLQERDTDNTIRDFLPTYEKHLERLGLEC